MHPITVCVHLFLKKPRGCRGFVFVLKSAFEYSRGDFRIILRFNKFLLIVLTIAVSVTSSFAQDSSTDTKPATDTTAAPAPVPTPALSEEQLKGFQIVESAILVYSNLMGRNGLNQIRKTSVEYGTLEFFGTGTNVLRADYEKRILRGDSISKAKVRLDQSFPNTKYSMVYDGSMVFGVLSGSNTVFDPRADAISAFRNREMYGLEALLRYNESESKIVFDREDKVMGVDYTVIKLTTKDGTEVFFYVSKKSFRVMFLEYEEAGVKFLRKFYDYNYAQNTLVPYRTVLWANDKKIEEQRTSTITYGQEFGDEIFKRN